MKLPLGVIYTLQQHPPPSLELNQSFPIPYQPLFTSVQYIQLLVRYQEALRFIALLIFGTRICRIDRIERTFTSHHHLYPRRDIFPYLYPASRSSIIDTTPHQTTHDTELAHTRFISACSSRSSTSRYRQEAGGTEITFGVRHHLVCN
jgi:hypothetical protein